MTTETRAEYVEFEQPAETDDQLMARAQAGDERAVEELFGRYYDEAYRFARRKTAREADADDVTQEVFIHAFRSLNTYREGSFPAWLQTIAKNTFINHYQKEKLISDKTVSGDAHDWRSIPAQGPDPADQVTIQEDTKRILNKLPEPHRDTVRHVLVGDWSPEEYAALRGIPRATVNTRFFRARKILSKMQDEGVLTGYHTRQKP